MAPGSMMPMRGIFDTDCCARAASGHAAAPPRSAMNERRFTAQVPPVLSTERIAHLDGAGDCCAAEFQPGVCRLWVRVGPSVECALDSGQFQAAVLTGCWAWRSSYCAGLR